MDIPKIIEYFETTDHDSLCKLLEIPLFMNYVTLTNPRMFAKFYRRDISFGFIHTKIQRCVLITTSWNGKLHSFNGAPSVIRIGIPMGAPISLDDFASAHLSLYPMNWNAEYEWHNHGVLHRADGPARENFYVSETYINGRYHSIADRPARVHNHGVYEWYENGVLHRMSGPAVINKDYRIYYNNGVITRVEQKM